MSGGAERGGVRRPDERDLSGSVSARRPRILLLIKCLGYGGAERLLVDMSAHRDRLAFEYEVAFVLNREDALVPAMERTGVPVHRLGAAGNWDLRWLVALRRLLVDGRYDLVHSHLPYAASLARPVARSLPKGRRPALVYTEHSMWDKMAVVVKGLNRATIGLDQALVVVSDTARTVLPAPVRSRARVVVHGVDLDRSAELVDRRDALRRRVRAEFDVGESECLVVTVANLRREKGYDTLLEATRLLVARGVRVQVLSVGRGPLRRDLEASRDALGLDGWFRFAGQRDDALEIIAGADLFVLASRQEGLPVALMEAASVGSAIVATSVGDIPRLFTSEIDAVVVAPERADELADAIERLAGAPELRQRLGQGALARRAQFDVAAATAEIEGIYRTVLDARS
ncbi:MAG TPA: glycosyltransferase [Acidimicrobiales bacterium]|nr:glycosyltransferase [Acidimicrobiales bacterium]